jgi:4-hydroxy-tetrahydrodipicolinate reductase
VTNVAVVGAAGRMGQAILRLVAAEGLTLVGAVEDGRSPAVGRDAGELAGVGSVGVAVSPDLSSGLLGADVVIDFSTPEVTKQVLHVAAKKGVAIVSGTTGLGVDVLAALDDAAAHVAVLWASNMSLGVQVLAELSRQAARMLPGFDVEIVEAHHRLKADAPSGTAKSLLEAVQSVREGRAVTGREGRPGARMDDEIGVFALRGGDVIGDHTVHFLGPGERLELTHRATNRDLFARGALRAARVLASKPKGRYTMADVAKSLLGN